jgi:hypothetical protein
MLFKLLWALILFLLGLSALNNYFTLFTEFIYLDDRTLMLLNGIFLIIAGLIILVQKVLLKFHKSF